LVEHLLQKDKHCTVDVISTLPNRYSSFFVNALRFEQQDRLNIHRVKIRAHKNGIFDQVISFVNYYIKALKLSNNNDYDLVVATSSRLFTAFLGKRIANKKNLPLYLDIRDIFVDTLVNILPRKLFFVLSPFLKLIENYTFQNAKKINLVSEGFRPYFEARYPRMRYDFFTNGIDNEFIQAQKKHNVIATDVNDIKTIVYAGNIGDGQGLHLIIPQLAAKLGEKFLIQVIGDGGRKSDLIDAVGDAEINNVQFLQPVSRTKLIEYYRNADVLFLHLNTYEAFKKVLPSKLFEYASFDKPILAGVSGYAAQFIKDYIDSAEIFYPCDVDGAVKAVDNLDYQCEQRVAFVEKYSRDIIMNNMADSILSLSNSNTQHD
jgi:glycosyltransferase involved in cell wall biosynthesis